MKKILIHLFAIVVSAGVCLVPHAYADVRIATVDITRVLNESKEARVMKSELDSASTTAKKELEGKRTALQAMEKKLKGSGASNSSKEAESFREQAREFVRLAKDTEDKLRGEFMKSNKSLTQKTLKIVEAYAKKNDIDLVLDKSDKIRGAVMFRAQPFDITDDIITQVNAG